MHAGDGDLIDAVTDAAAEGLSALNASNVKILSDIDNKQTWSQGELFGWLGMVSGFANQVTPPHDCARMIVLDDYAQ